MLITTREEWDPPAFREKSQFLLFTNVWKYGNFSSTNIKGKKMILDLYDEIWD